MAKTSFKSFLIYIILICLLSSTTAQLSNFEYCSSNNYPIVLETFTFSPNPIEVGKNLITTVIGTNNASIQSGAMMKATFSYYGKIVDIKNINLCNEIMEGKCPIAIGNFDINVQSNFSLGTDYSSNTTYTLDTVIIVNNNDNENLLCIRGPLTIIN